MTVDPFDGFFSGRHPPPPDSGTLVHTRDAQAWFEYLAWGVERGLYSYQQPVEARRGSRVRIDGRWFLSLSSYDYLGLLEHRDVLAAATEAIRRYGAGSGGVRLLTGTLDLHRTLERDLAAFKGVEAALVLGSGYLANLGVLTALLGPRDRALVDAHAHRSIVDGCRLAGVRMVRFPHNDLAALRRVLQRESTAGGNGKRRGGRTLIVVEGVYSMDGDVCPLSDLVALKRQYGAFLMVDEAHSFGVLGSGGRGVDEFWGVPPQAVDVWTGSLAKAIPTGGGYVAAARDVLVYLQHTAAPFIFSAALAPAAAAGARAALAVLRAEPERCRKAMESAARLRHGLTALGYDTGASCSPIVPVLLGARETAYRAARCLEARGIAASAVAYPAVAPTASRLRLCGTALLEPADVACALEAFGALRETLAAPVGDGNA